MKTIEEFYMDIQEKECPNVNNLILPEEWQLKAMKLYANAKLDEAAEKITGISGKWEHEANKQSILSLKDKV